MSDFIKNADALPAPLSRRQFLRVGVLGGLTLSAISTTALLTGCSSPPASSSFHLLRENDLKILRALLPVVLAGELPKGGEGTAAVEETLRTIDGVLFRSSLAGHKQNKQLFDLLQMPFTRYTLAGVSRDWAAASPEDIEQFLLRWQGSRVPMFRGAYLALTQLINMCWYLQPRSWAAINYIPPRVVG